MTTCRFLFQKYERKTVKKDNIAVLNGNTRGDFPTQMIKQTGTSMKF